MKIYIATTFREFDGSENDKIQVLFLNSLKQQRYKNFELVVTTFEEKTVKNKLSSFDLNIRIFEETRNNYRFSLTKVVKNAVDYAEKNNVDKNYFIIWTTCDVIFEENFLEVISRYHELSGKRACIISHPHLIYYSVKDFYEKKYIIHGPNDGIDYVGFSGALINEDFKHDISSYFFSDWGVFEHFLVALSVKYHFKRFNIFELSKVHKIINDRTVNNENEDYFKMSLNKNWPVLERFLNNSNLSKEYFSLTYCNLQFKIAGGILANLKYRIKYIRTYMKYFRSYLIKSIISIIPKNVKSLVKSVVKGGMKK